MRKRLWAACLLLLLMYSPANFTSFHASAAEDGDGKTLLEIEIILPAAGGALLDAQNWRQAFEKLGEPVRLRQGIGSDKPDLKELSRGPFRVVQLTGELSRTGEVSFPGKKFSLQQTSELHEWLNELKTYGAQGSPEGKPHWGLSKEQFESVWKHLGAPVREVTRERRFEECWPHLQPPAALPVQVHSSARDVWEMAQTAVIVEELSELSRGTALAYALSQQGLAMRPARTPGGGLQLEIRLLTQVPDPWPIGWPVDEKTPRNQLAPGLFQTFTASFDRAPLLSVLTTAEERSGTPLLIDRRAADERELRWEEQTFTQPEKRTAWSMILQSATIRARLTTLYRQDEAGAVFLLVEPFRPARVAPAQSRTP